MRLTRLLASAGVVCAALAMAATSALAVASTFTLTAGTAPAGTLVDFAAASTGTSPQFKFVDTTSNIATTCVSNSFAGKFRVGHGQAGANIGSVSGPTFTSGGCAGPFGIRYTFSGARGWSVNASSGTPGGAGGTITSVDIEVSDPGVCSYTLTGSIPFDYANASASMTFPGTGTELTLSNVPAGQCFGVLNNGDNMTFKAGYLVRASNSAYNPIHITSPEARACGACRRITSSTVRALGRTISRSPVTTTLIRKAAVVAAGAGIALGGAAAIAPSADAAPVLSVVYDASGTSHIAKPNSDVKLGPTTLTTDLNADGSFTGSLPLPTTSASFKVLGLVPVTSTVDFVPVGQLTGSLKGTNVTSTAKYYIRLSNVKLAGIPAFVGNKCQTSSPVTINVATPAGQKFDILKGGTVAGTYTIGNFANCGLTTGLVNLLVPGTGNTVSFTLSNGRLAGS